MHKSRCNRKPSVDSHHQQKEEGEVVRLEVKRGGDWEDAGQINLIDGMASATINSKAKELPIATQRLLGPESSNKYKYRHSQDGVDENLLIFFHGAGDSYLPFDALGKRMELPQTATLSISASISMDMSHEKDSNNKIEKFVELPFGLGYTWYAEMDYSTGEKLPMDHPNRLKSLNHAVKLMDLLLSSLTGISSERDNNASDATWIPERIFLFGFSAGACLVMELCRMRFNAGRLPLGGAICIAGGIQNQGELQITQQNQPTNVLIITGSKDTAYPPDAANLSKQLYHASKVHVHFQKGKGHSMIESKEEMRVIMEFLSKCLVRRMVSMEGQSSH